MPIKDCPFTQFSAGIHRAMLPVTILNPHTGNSLQTYGMIDTGADECAIPADIANLLGHNLSAGSTKQISTGNGMATSYAHTTSLKIHHPVTKIELYQINDIPVDFMPNLHVLLLGVKSFLSQFVLNIDYPNQVFSITGP